MGFEPDGERRVPGGGGEAVDQAQRGAEIGGRAGDLDVEMVRAETLRLADPVGELGRVVDEHLPFPCEAERVHRARDAVGPRSAREVDADAVEARGDDFGERFSEAVFDVETGAFVEAPDRLEDEQFGQRLSFQTALSYLLPDKSQMLQHVSSSCRT